MKGHVYQRSKGSWTIVYDLPSDGSGKRKQKTETFRDITKKQAEQKLRDRLTALDNGSYIPVARETVAQFLERWLETYAATNTTARTQEGYLGNISRYIVPAIGNVELQKLTPAQIQNMYARLLERGLSNRTVLHVHRVLSESLRHAMRWSLLARNPADATTPPRAEQEEMEMWDVPTIYLFLEAIEGHRFQDFYQLALLTGMRRSETWWPGD
jgi:integrase